MDINIIEKYKKEIQQKTQDKYNRPGIYCIKINDKIVYIGKSQNVLGRLAAHICHIKGEGDEQHSHKYEVLRQALDSSFSIGFDLLEEVNDEALGEREGYYIRQYMPPLNYQIPKENDWRHFEVNKKALSVTLEDLMGTDQ